MFLLRLPLQAATYCVYSRNDSSPHGMSSAWLNDRSCDHGLQISLAGRDLYACRRRSCKGALPPPPYCASWSLCSVDIPSCIVFQAQHQCTYERSARRAGAPSKVCIFRSFCNFTLSLWPQPKISEFSSKNDICMLGTCYCAFA